MTDYLYLKRLEYQVEQLQKQCEMWRTRAQGYEYEHRTMFRTQLNEKIHLLDAFDRCFAVSETVDDGDVKAYLESWLGSFEMVRKKLIKSIEKMGVTFIPAVGQPFNSDLHSAHSVEYREDVDDETVITELVRGFMVGDHIIRTSVVVVSTNDPHHPALEMPVAPVDDVQQPVDTEQVETIPESDLSVGEQGDTDTAQTRSANKPLSPATSQPGYGDWNNYCGAFGS